MCDPITLAVMAAGTLASTAGAGISARENIDNNTNIAAARNKALQETNARNLARSDESRAALMKRLDASTAKPAQDELTAQQMAAQRDIQDNRAPATEPMMAGNDAPAVVKSSLGKALSDAAAKSTAKGAAQGALTGYSLFNKQQAIGDQDLANQINTNNSFVRGDNALLSNIQDYEQIKANKSGSGLGDILQTAGQLAAGYAGNRSAKKPAAAPSIY